MKQAGGASRGFSLQDQVWKASTAILALAVSYLLYDRLGLQSRSSAVKHISVEWLPTGQYFRSLSEAWVRAGPSTDLQTLHVRHLPHQPAICILMVDTRPCDLDSYGVANGAKPPEMAAVTPSLALHYALLHGYDYVRSRIPADTERVAAWYDVPLLRTLTEEHRYKFVFKMDADSYFHQIELRIEPLIRLHRLDKDKVLWVPRDISFPGFEFPDSNINAGVLLIARQPETPAMLKAWWRCPIDGPGHPSLTVNWPAEQGCLWQTLVNSSAWAHACAPDWDTEFIGRRPGWVHHLTSGSSSAEERNMEGAVETVRYFLHSVRQALLTKQMRLGYSEYRVMPR